MRFFLNIAPNRIATHEKEGGQKNQLICFIITLWPAKHISSATGTRQLDHCVEFGPCFTGTELGGFGKLHPRSIRLLQGTGLWHNFSSPTTNRKLILLTLVSVLVCYNQEFARAWISFGILRDLILLETWFESKIFSNSFALNKKNLHQRINSYGKLILKLFYFRIISNFISTFSKTKNT